MSLFNPVYIKPTTMRRRPGTPGLTVVLVDITASVPGCYHTSIDLRILEWWKVYPNLRVFSFIYGVDEVTNPGRYTSVKYARPASPPEGGAFSGILGSACSTYLDRALEYVAAFQPQKTIVFSDGATNNKDRALQIADAMPGCIDAFYCHPYPSAYTDEELTPGALNVYRQHWSKDRMRRYLSKDADYSFMQKLARRGGGGYVRLDAGTDFNAEFDRAIHPQWVEHRTRVYHERLPDLHIYPGDR